MADRIHGFISYAHGADFTLAGEVRTKLRRLAIPWYRHPVLSIFLDQTALAATSDMWGKIEAELAKAEFLILFASPKAAASIGVRREVDWWLQHKSLDKILIVLTDGILRWNKEARDFEWPQSTALPENLRGRFYGEPLYVDLRHREKMPQAQFQQRILSLAAALHGRSPAELAGEDNRQLRTTIRVLFIALFAFIVLSVYANQQRSRAEKQTRSAIAQTLALRARVAMAEPRMDKSLLLSAHAVRLNPSLENVATLKDCIRFPKLPMTILHTGTNLARSATFSRDGTMIVATLNDGGFAFWNAATLQRTNVSLSGLYISPHVAALAVVAPRSALTRLADPETTWNFLSRESRGGIMDINGPKHIWWDHDGNLAAIGELQGGPLLLWKIAEGRAVCNLATNHHFLRCATFSPNGRCLATGAGQFADGEYNTVILWDTASGQLLAPPLAGSKGQIDSLAFSPDSRILAVGSVLGGLMLVDVANGPRILGQLEGHAFSVESLAFSPDGRVLASGGQDKTIRLWDVEKRESFGVPLTAHRGDVRGLDFSPDGRQLASVGYYGEVFLWSLPSRVATNGRPYEAVSPDGKIVASGRNDVLLLDAATGKPLAAPLATRLNGQWGLAFSADGKRFAAGSPDGPVVIWDVESKRQLGSYLVGQQGPVFGLAFSPNGQLLAVGSWDRTIKLWEVGKSKVSGPLLVGHKAGVYCLAFSPDGKTLASGGWDTSIILWSLSTRQPLGGPLLGHEAGVKSLAFNSDGTTLASTSEDGTAIVWDVVTRRPLQPPLGGLKRNGSMERGQFSSDGKILKCTDSDGTVVDWILNRDSTNQLREPIRTNLSGWVDVARQMANRELTPAEIKAAFGELENRLYESLWR